MCHLYKPEFLIFSDFSPWEELRLDTQWDGGVEQVQKRSTTEHKWNYTTVRLLLHLTT